MNPSETELELSDRIGELLQEKADLEQDRDHWMERAEKLDLLVGGYRRNLHSMWELYERVLDGYMQALEQLNERGITLTREDEAA